MEITAFKNQRERNLKKPNALVKSLEGLFDAPFKVKWKMSKMSLKENYKLLNSWDGSITGE